MGEVVVALVGMEAARLASSSRGVIRVRVARLCKTARLHLPNGNLGDIDAGSGW